MAIIRRIMPMGIIRGIMPMGIIREIMLMAIIREIIGLGHLAPAPQAFYYSGILPPAGRRSQKWHPLNEMTKNAIC